jgi:hypothetical protein
VLLQLCAEVIPITDRNNLVVEQKVIVYNRLRDGKRGKSKKLMIHMYNTNSTMLINGSMTKTFSAEHLPALERALVDNKTLSELDDQLYDTLATARPQVAQLYTQRHASDAPVLTNRGSVRCGGDSLVDGQDPSVREEEAVSGDKQSKSAIQTTSVLVIPKSGRDSCVGECLVDGQELSAREDGAVSGDAQSNSAIQTTSAMQANISPGVVQLCRQPGTELSELPMTLCIICDQDADVNAVQCEKCTFWVHYHCERLSINQIDNIVNGHGAVEAFTCSGCAKQDEEHVSGPVETTNKDRKKKATPTTKSTKNTSVKTTTT